MTYSPYLWPSYRLVTLAPIRTKIPIHLLSRNHIRIPAISPQCAKYFRNHIPMDILSPQDIYVLIIPQPLCHGMIWQRIQENRDINKGVMITPQKDDRRDNIASWKSNRMVGGIV